MSSSRVTAGDWDASRTWIARPGADIAGYAAGLAGRFAFDIGAKLREWSERGLVIFERAADPAVIDEYLLDLEHLTAHPGDYELMVELAAVSKPIGELTPSELDRSRVKLVSVHSLSRAACRLSLTRPVSEFLSCVFGGPPCVLQSLTFMKGSQQPIHIDYPYVRTQTRLAHLAASWVALEDVDPRSGPLAYYPGSHRPEVSGFFDWGGGSILLEPDSSRTPMDFAHYLWDRMAKAGIEPVTFCPRKGDVLVWHGALAHGGTPILSPELTRKSYVTHYTSLEGYPPAHMKPGALETGAYISENGGFAFDFPWLTSPARLPSWGNDGSRGRR